MLDYQTGIWVICEMQNYERVICKKKDAKMGKLRNRKCKMANYVNEQQT